MSTTTLKFTGKESLAPAKILQPTWQRIILLSMIGYEAAGCLAGGLLLTMAPDGRLMDMPVDMMHGVFPNFLIPGIILFGLGILNSFAFVSVLRRLRNDWLMANLAMGGLFIWFLVEIAILKELHWLHAMWGIPVLLGWTMAIPLIVLRHDTDRIRKILLACGILSTLWYLVINIIVPPYYEGYSSVTQTVSELSAIGAPTRVLWFLLCVIYPLLYVAFGWGVFFSSAGNRSLRFMAIAILIYGGLNFYWPPMHTREVLAAGGGTLSDSLHIAWAMMTLVFNMIMMGFGLVALGKGFRYYTIATIVVFIIFGILIGIETPGIQTNSPTPGIGIWERINIAAFMLWIAVLAFVLLRRKNI